MIVEIVLILAWVNIAFIEGVRDAFLYHHRNYSVKPDKHSIHWVFALERGIVLGLICSINALSNSMLSTGVFVVSLMLIFSFLHNGKYYSTRNLLDPTVYPRGWWDSSTTSTSFLEFSVVPRVFMAIVGCIGLIASSTIK